MDGGGGFIFEKCYIHVMVYVKLRADVMWDYLIELKERIRPPHLKIRGAYID